MNSDKAQRPFGELLEKSKSVMKSIADSHRVAFKPFNKFDGDKHGEPTTDRKAEKRSIETSSGSISKKTKYTYDWTDDKYIKVFTDGACPNNGKTGAKAGIGVWFGENHPLNTSMKCPGRQTNNTAEILACVEACKLATLHDVEKLEINTDSKFVIDCMTKWIHNWKKNNWKTSAKKPVINKDELIVLEKCMACFKDVRFVYVPGHSGNPGNEGADKLAVKGATM